MKLFYCDVETTGLEPSKNGIIQLAGIVEVDSVQKELVELKIKPFEGDLVDDKALEVNKVSMEEMQEYMHPRDAYAKIVGILDQYVDKFDREDKFHFVAQNASFDYDFLKAFFLKNGNAYFGSYFHYHKIDLIGITALMRITGHLIISNMKLQTVMKALGLGEQTHTAINDVIAVRDIFYKYVEMVKG